MIKVKYKRLYSSVLKPLHLIFRNYLQIESFFKKSKKASIIPVNKKCYKQFSPIWTEHRNLLVNLRIQSEFGKIRTRETSIFEHFSSSVILVAH